MTCSSSSSCGRAKTRTNSSPVRAWARMTSSVTSVGTFDAFAQYAWKGYRFSLNGSNITDEWYLKRSANRNIFWTGPERLIKFRIARSF